MRALSAQGNTGNNLIRLRTSQPCGAFGQPFVGAAIGNFVVELNSVPQTVIGVQPAEGAFTVGVLIDIPSGLALTDVVTIAYTGPASAEERLFGMDNVVLPAFAPVQVEIVDVGTPP
jgi:hypothetical protein